MEGVVYTVGEKQGLVFAQRLRDGCLFILFLVSLCVGTALLVHFPSDSCPDEVNSLSVGLGISLLIFTCCSLTQLGCNCYDERQLVEQQATKFAAADLGAKACGGVSVCWQFCIFASCLGI